MTQSIVYHAQTAGLANRLRALVGYQALARCLGVPFHLCWVAAPGCAAEYGDLFHNGTADLISPEAVSRFEGDKSVAIYGQPHWFDRIWQDHGREIVPRQQFYAQVRHCLEELEPIASIAESVAEFVDAHDLAASAAVHVRLTDNVQKYSRWASNEPGFDPACISEIGGFEKFISDRLMANPSGKVFLATDNRQVQRHMSRLFLGQIVIYPKQFTGKVRLLVSRMTSRSEPHRTSAIEDALIELLILSRCALIAGTYYSSFSPFSAILGQSQYVEVRGSAYVENKFVSRMQRDLAGI